MNIRPNMKIGRSVCPHDCPSACALEVEVLDDRTIGRLRGAKDNSYTDGVICEKVARYAERIHHPERLTHPLKRVGPKGSGQFERISWDEALDTVAKAFLTAEAEHGPESVWPYYYAGTMGLVMRDGIERLTSAKGYSHMYGTFCIALSWPGYYAGVGKIAGIDPREMRHSDLIVVWGGNPVNTQVNVMTHALKARKERGTKIACVDIYNTGTMQQADIKMIIRPGTDGALACAVAHVLFRDEYADWDYLRKYTDCPEEFEKHLKTRTPEWASKICDVPVADIEAFAALIGQTTRTFYRIGYGFTRSRNGSVNMHAVTCLPAITGAWQYEGGGALHSNSGMYKWNKTLIEGLDAPKGAGRSLDQSRIGPVLLGDPRDLAGGPPVKAMLVQNTNPASVAPDQTLVKGGLAREDLFLCVHEQFMTETAMYADIVLPATMFLEHDDLYQGGGHSHIMFGGKQVNAPGECRTNHEVIAAIAQRVGAEHRGFTMEPKDIIAETLRASRRASFDELQEKNWIDVMPDFETAHCLNGFGHADKKFHFKPDWRRAAFLSRRGALGPIEAIPPMPDHWEVIEEANDEFPFRLATSPARTFLNSTFNETPSSVKREVQPTVLAHAEDMAKLGLRDGDRVQLGNVRGSVTLCVKAAEGQRRGVLIAEGIWPNTAYEDGCGINTLTGCDQPAPAAGGAFHDSRVWMRKA